MREVQGSKRPVHLIITMIEWIRTSRLSIKKSLSQVVADTSMREVQGSKEQQVQLKAEMERTEVCISLA